MIIAVLQNVVRDAAVSTMESRGRIRALSWSAAAMVHQTVSPPCLPSPTAGKSWKEGMVELALMHSLAQSASISYAPCDQLLYVPRFLSSIAHSWRSDVRFVHAYRGSFVLLLLRTGNFFEILQ